MGDDDDYLSDVAEDLAEKAHRSTSTFLFIMLFLIFIGYIFRKRDTRLRLYRGVGSTFGRKGRPGSPRKFGRRFFGAGKLFGRSSQHYERVLEDGDGANEFELGEVDSDENEHSDSSEGSRLGRASGLATPRMNVVHFDTGTSATNYFDTTHGGPVGLGLHSNGSGTLPNAMDRSGLVVRTESRERLAPAMQKLGAGRRSRTGSPTRLKSPLMTSLEED
jgi:Golgi apyrase